MTRPNIAASYALLGTEDFSVTVLADGYVSDGTEQLAEIPEQPIGKEIGWFQAYVRNCRGWLNPQKVLPELVGD